MVWYVNAAVSWQYNWRTAAELVGVDELQYRGDDSRNDSMVVSSSMMLTYRPIQNEINYAREIWIAEEKHPRWYREAGYVWHKNLYQFIEFWLDCREIYGLFDGDTLVSCVYLQLLSPISVNIHVSVIAPVKNRDLIRFFTSLKNEKARDGVQMMTGWLLGRNRGLIEVARAAGFSESGARMDYGQSRGRVLRWIQVRA